MLLALLFLAERAVAQQGPPVELGAVQWHFDYDAAAALARQQGKPLLILFQEIPGCSTCRNYGRAVLSQPLLAEAAETLFVPIAVHNNRPGKDAEVLARYREPAWNNPVVRIVTADGTPLAPRLNGDHTLHGLTSAMVTALKQAAVEVPVYLDLLARESAAESRVRHAVFGMSCFWTGEAVLGTLDGVVATRPGFLQGREVVDVRYDPEVVSYAELVRAAHRKGCAQSVVARSAREREEASRVVGQGAVLSEESIQPDREPKHHLSRTAFRFLPMTPLQAARVNSALAGGADPLSVLSPRQITLWETMGQCPDARWPVVTEADFATAWAMATALAGGFAGVP